jgi:hypothetical protein
MDEAGPADPGRETLLDIDTPHPARRYNYWLGGKGQWTRRRGADR